MEKARAIVAYIPVLHEGYRQLFSRHPDAASLYLFHEDVLPDFTHLIKDIRRLNPEWVKTAVESWHSFERVALLTPETIRNLQVQKTPLVISDDDITAALIDRYFPDHDITIDTVFLRWDKKTSVAPMPISPDVVVSEDVFDQNMMTLAIQEGVKSKDWWRRIGAMAIKDGNILFLEHNRYVPSEHIAYDEGDPRGNFKSGERFESSLALHAEAGLVARAAKEGVSLAGAEIYCDTFPCPPCAKQLAYSGIARLFYRNGYAVLDGERILKSQGVEIVYVSGNFL